MNKQIEETFKKAFFDILNQDGPDSYDYLRKLLDDETCGNMPPLRSTQHSYLKVIHQSWLNIK